jgi:hypothetical protein
MHTYIQEIEYKMAGTTTVCFVWVYGSSSPCDEDEGEKGKEEEDEEEEEEKKNRSICLLSLLYTYIYTRIVTDREQSDSYKNSILYFFFLATRKWDWLYSVKEERSMSSTRLATVCWLHLRVRSYRSLSYSNWILWTFVVFFFLHGDVSLSSLHYTFFFLLSTSGRRRNIGKVLTWTDECSKYCLIMIAHLDVSSFLFSL